MLKTFKKGGVHPSDNKLTAGKKIEVLAVPEQVVIPLSQHIGAPSNPLVKKGDVVKTGQLIAEATGFVSANIHSPVSGKVLKIDQVVDASGYRKEAVVISVDGDEWMEGIDLDEKLVRECNLDVVEITNRIKEAGIVGLGGATFPSHVKVSIPKDKKAEYLVINGVECEPFLTSDHRLMMEKGEEILVGVTILMKVLQVEKCIIGIENNKPDAIDHLTQLSINYPGIQIQPLKVKYPQGGEKQLIKAVINKEVPAGKLPIEVGAVVFNVGTTYAIYQAVQKNKPLVERVVTVTGKNLNNPGNFLVRIGTSVNKLIEAAGGLPENTGKVINGGPMMGKALSNLDVPVTKGSSGILLLEEKEAKRKEPYVCIRCSKCVQICPMSLEPYLLKSESERQLYDRAENDRIMDCIECGSCSYICPSNLPLLDFIRLGKMNVSKIIRNRK